MQKLLLRIAAWASKILPNSIKQAIYKNKPLAAFIRRRLNRAAPTGLTQVTIAAGDGDCLAINFDAVDGIQNAHGILTADCDATSADTEAVAIVRNAKVVEANLVLPVTNPVVSADQKAAAMAQLLAKGIVSVKEV